MTWLSTKTRDAQGCAELILLHNSLVLLLISSSEIVTSIGWWYTSHLSNVLFVYSAAVFLLSVVWISLGYGVRPRFDFVWWCGVLVLISLGVSVISGEAVLQRFFGLGFENYTGVYVVSVVVYLLALRFLFSLYSPRNYFRTHVVFVGMVGTLVVMGLLLSLVYGSNTIEIEGAVATTETSEMLTTYTTDATPQELFIGGHNFAELWPLYQPKTFNQSEDWSLYITHSKSFILTQFVQTGLIGVFTWCAFWISVVSVVLYRSVTGIKSRPYFSALSSIISLGICALFVGVSLSILFTISGVVFLAVLLRSQTVSYHRRYHKKVATLVAAICLLSTLFLAQQWFVALWHFDRGLDLFFSGYPTTALGELDAAVHPIGHTQVYWVRSLVRMEQIESVLRMENSDFDLDSAVALLVTDSNTATLRAPNTYVTWSVLARAYVLLRRLEVPDASRYGFEALKNAKELAPLHPGVWYTEAELLVLGGDYKQARETLSRVQTLKFDYVPTQTLRAFIDQQEKEN